jgi:hypothetical protein
MFWECYNIPKKESDKKLLVELPARSLESKLLPALSLQIGRILGFYSRPRTESWYHAGRLYIMNIVCKKLYNDVVSAAAGGAETSKKPGEATPQRKSKSSSGNKYPHLSYIDNSKEEEGEYENSSNEEEENDDNNDEEWKAGTASSNLLKICVAKVWADKYISEKHSYNEQSMLNEWLLEGIDLYANLAKKEFSWKDLKVKCFHPSLVPEIRKTAQLTWIKSFVSSKHSISESGKLVSCPPDTNWITDWVSKPIIANRAKWEKYYSYVISKAKTAPFRQAEERRKDLTKKGRTTMMTMIIIIRTMMMMMMR